MEVFSALLSLCVGNLPISASPHGKASDAELWCFNLALNALFQVLMIMMIRLNENYNLHLRETI